MEGAIGDIDIANSSQQSVAAAEAALHHLYMFLRCLGVYVPISKSKCSWIHGAYCIAVTLSSWYLLFRLYPILLSDQHDAMDKVWYISIYAGFAAIVTWIFVKNKCNVQVFNTSIIFIKTLPEKSCIKFAKWCKIGFFLLTLSILSQFILFIGRFAVLTIFEWYNEEFYHFNLLPFNPNELDTTSEYFYITFICVIYYVTITQYSIHTLMLIVFTKFSQFAYENNFEQIETTFSCLPQLSDLATSQLPNKVTAPAQRSENSDRLVQSAKNLSTATQDPNKQSEQIQHQENDQPASLISNKHHGDSLDSESTVHGHPNKHIAPIQQLENLATSSEANNNFAEHIGDDHQNITSEHSITITTEETIQHSDEHNNRITQATLEACRTYYENISEYVSTIDAFYHFSTGVSLGLGTFVACVSLYYLETDSNIDFLVYSLILSSFTLAVCLYCGVATNNAVSIVYRSELYFLTKFHIFASRNLFPLQSAH